MERVTSMKQEQGMDGVEKHRVKQFFLSSIITTSLVVAFVPSVEAQRELGRSPSTGKELFEAACASCHGSRGAGAERSIVGFDVPLPDFADCSFASREPDGDWGGVVHSGGPLRGFDEMMPAFSDAVSMEEIGKILDYVRSFCVDDNWPRGELNLPRPMITEKAYPEDEIVWTTGVATEGGAVSNELVYEKRFGARNQFELVLPLDFHELEAGEWTGGIGDIAIGAKRALYHSLASGSIFSVNGEIILPTGNEEKGLGKGVTIIEPFVSFGQILPADSFLHAQAGIEIPTDSERAEQEAFWRFVLGKSFTQGRYGRTWSPMVEILAVRELAEGEGTKWDLLPQVQITLNTRQHVMANIGFLIPLNDTEGRDTTFLVYLLWDWFDGGFFEGW
jgi:hypothetical protein